MRAKNKQAKKGSSSSQNIDDNEDISEIMPPIQPSATNFEIPVNEDEVIKVQCWKSKLLDIAHFENLS